MNVVRRCCTLQEHVLCTQEYFSTLKIQRERIESSSGKVSRGCLQIIGSTIKAMQKKNLICRN